MSPTQDGITADDMPGKSSFEQRMNLSLFRRGKLSGYGSCRGLQGAAQKAELKRLKTHYCNRGMNGGEARKEQFRQANSKLNYP